MAVDYRRPALLCQTSVVDKLLSTLLVSLLLVASTPRVHSQSMITQCFKHRQFTVRIIVGAAFSRHCSRQRSDDYNFSLSCSLLINLNILLHCEPAHGIRTSVKDTSNYSTLAVVYS